MVKSCVGYCFFLNSWSLNDKNKFTQFKMGLQYTMGFVVGLFIFFNLLVLINQQSFACSGLQEVFRPVVNKLLPFI